MKSKRYTLNREELDKWLKNTAIFLAPALLVFLLVIKSGGSVNDGLVAVYLWGLNVSIDFLKKFTAGSK